MLKIDRVTNKIKDLLKKFSVVALVGSRQSGETTLANQIKASCEGPVHYFDLENPLDMQRMEDPFLTLNHGRIAYLELSGAVGIGYGEQGKIVVRGGHPKSFLAESDDDSFEWRDAYIKAFFGKDLPELGVKVMGAQLRRFCFMASHYHRQIWSHLEIARSLGVRLILFEVI